MVDRRGRQAIRYGDASVQEHSFTRGDLEDHRSYARRLPLRRESSARKANNELQSNAVRTELRGFSADRASRRCGYRWPARSGSAVHSSLHIALGQVPGALPRGFARCAHSLEVARSRKLDERGIDAECAQPRRHQFGRPVVRAVEDAGRFRSGPHRRPALATRHAQSPDAKRA